jgi:WD40 repeat protein
MSRAWLWLCFCPGALAVAGALPADEAKPKPLATISVKGKAAFADAQWMDFLPGGRLLAVRSRLAGTNDAAVAVYDVGTGKPVVSATVKGGAAEQGAPCGVAPGGEWVVYTEGDLLRFLAVPPHQPDLPGKGRIDLPKRRDPDDPAVWVWPTDAGKAVLVARGSQGSLQLEKCDLSKRTSSPVDRPVQVNFVGNLTLNVSAGRAAASTWDDEAEKAWVRYWALGERTSKTDIPVPHKATSLALAPDGKTVAVGFGNGTVGVYDTATGKVSKQFQLGEFPVRALAFHPGGKHLACGTTDAGMPNLFLIDLGSAEGGTSLIPDAKGVTAVCFSSDGKRLAAFGPEVGVTIWDATALLKLQRD